MNITLTSGKTIAAEKDKSILQSLKEAGIFLNSSCGGKGTCGKCRVIIKSGTADVHSQMKLSQEEIREGYALACKTIPSGDLLVDIPKESMLTVQGQIDTGQSKDLLALLHSSFCSFPDRHLMTTSVTLKDSSGSWLQTAWAV